MPGEIHGIPLLVEALPESGAEPTSRGRPIDQVQDMFGRAQEVIWQLALSAVEIREKLTVHARPPDQIELQFGIKFTAKGNIVLAGAGVESSLAVKVIYGHRPADEGDDDSDDDGSGGEDAAGAEGA
ncbi:CU044_2847 family protein [Actinomadura sp. NTSP31]|uniref:CU044_2847 family protein n=1 Tax=Actinomadura sp. NTSP31 TaxID=1735447 RepID=UPI0035C00ED8